MNKMINQLALWLSVIGAINWGLAVFDMNLVKILVGSYPMIEKAIYVLIGISGVWAAFTEKVLEKHKS